MGISPSLAFILFACKNVAFYTKQDFSRGHTVYGFWVFFCFLSESVDCERKSLDFEGRTWNGGKCGAIHTKAYLSSITSLCSGNEPALLLLLGRTERAAEIEPGWCRQQTNTQSSCFLNMDCKTFLKMTVETFSYSQDKTYAKHLQTLVNKNRQKAVLTGLPIFLRKGVAADLGHQACHWPLRDVTSHVRVLKTVTHLNIYPFGRCYNMCDFIIIS